MGSRTRFLMGFPFPLPEYRREHGKRKREAERSGGCLLPPPRKACHRAHGRQGQALRVAAKRRPSLTAARHGSTIELRSGRKNGFAKIEQKNA